MRKNMPKEDYDLFTVIAQSTQVKLKKMLYKILKRHYTNIENTQDYILAKGDIPIALVAHMDTVFKLPPEKIYFDRSEGVMWSPDGLGADDRAGVFLILKILQNVKKDKKPTIIFTTDEECGCIGATELVADFQTVPYDLKYIIQLDRRGKIDCVFYDDINEEFEKYVESFGFESNWGTLSDISIICPSWGVSGVNLSVGYEDEHQEIETLHIKYLYLTLQKVLMMLNDVDNAQYFKYEGSTSCSQWWRYGTRWGNASYWYDDEDDDWVTPYSCENSKSSETVYCNGCHKPLTKAIAIRAKDQYKIYHYYCGKCASGMVDWCDTCGAAFVNPNQAWNHTCADCVAKAWENNEDGNTV